MTELPYSAIGIMSGTSLDGVDLAYCIFNKTNDHWNYKIEIAETIPYTDEWRMRLSSLMQSDASTYAQTHAELGKYFGTLAKKFINQHQLKPNLIASHGHTVFHQPQKGFTAQVGDGSQIAALTGVDTVCDFRSKDVALGGQGAPLVPIGDQLLFSDYDMCINLGGIANISYQKNNQRIAYDICPVNIVLNELASLTGKIYDEDGKLAEAGFVDKDLLDAFNNLEYYKQSPPKSIGKEWIDKSFLPLVYDSPVSVEDRAATVCEHIDEQILKAINEATLVSAKNTSLKILITGGGAFNKYLVQLLRKSTFHQIIIPDEQTIAFKEALIFAFLGVLFLCDEVNVLSSVTGASRNHIGGAFYKA